ncbi:hypothetical protein [Novilysobacter selenitireducens]|uniref:Integrase n=1 Tax=Novilysobacter selenitireducens TaxID=2872639 RepID=A0ABS7T2I5_9GAMM|nr:hypothetical protein [Lysobacter selenitireducens]MBZ4038080.1 hypothetical protein [Lysobacter selenitireducens]
MFVDEDGKTTYWGDSRWQIGHVTLNFGYGPASSTSLGLTPTNGDLLKQCMAWFIWGNRRAISCNTLSAYFTQLKYIFSACSQLAVPIAAHHMGRFFNTIEAELAAAIRPSNREGTIARLHELWQASEWLGFTLLEPPQIARLRELVPVHEGQQHHFIPPRIWAYQAARMQAFLEDFIAHKLEFEALFQEITGAYRENFISLANAAKTKRPGRNPGRQAESISGCVYLGSFYDMAQRHGVAEVLARWMFSPGRSLASLPSIQVSVKLLAHYFNAVGLVGTSYLQCFSGIRTGEAMLLRSTCLAIESDAVLGDIHILNGETTKTIQEPDARWMVASTAAVAVEAMTAVARWRTDIATELGDIPLKEVDHVNPFLVQRMYEPWASSSLKVAAPSKRPNGYNIANWRTKVPGLFEVQALRITAEDEAYVRRFSANADVTRYGRGCIWHFTSHQYRRTIQVMMAASGVSLESRQQQLKHLASSQSAYYAKGFENLRLNRNFGDELISTRYELVSVEAGLLHGPEYVSPHGEARKSELLRFFDVSSRDEIAKAQKKGLLTVKQTVLGICTKSYCEYGGHDNYVHCPNCVDGLMDKRKRGHMHQEGRTIAARLIDIPAGTPLRSALEARSKAVERFMDVTA